MSERTWRKEFPPGSDRWADYNADELRLMKALREQLEAGEIPTSAYTAQVECIHALKVEFGVTFPPVAAEPVEPAPEPEQLGLSDPDEQTVGKHHADAGTTERLSAKLQFPKSGIDRRTVLDYVASCGDAGATDDEIASATGLLRYTAAPRRNELLNGGWVMDSGRRRSTNTRSPANVWVLTAAARTRLAADLAA